MIKTWFRNMQKKFLKKKIASIKKDPKMSSVVVQMYDPNDRLILFFAPQSWGEKIGKRRGGETGRRGCGLSQYGWRWK